MLDFLESRPNYRELREAFLAGYCDECPLTIQHAAHLNLFLAARWVMIGLSLAREPGNGTNLSTYPDVTIPKLRKFLVAPESTG
jgi:Ser/Thr protein kinase RdoA (MazF antagonist)